MKNFDTRTYSISDFIEWEKNGLLELSPDFQRRSVWNDKAKSYLIDTIVRGKPMPKVIILQRLEGAKNIRSVVDGQQRLRAILGYYHGDFKISKAHNKELSAYSYETLPNNLDKEFLKYELGVDLLFDTPYAEILDIFARINSYTVKLEPQETYNAKYLGFFKQTVYRIGFKYVNFFIESEILSKSKVTRMAEAGLSADLIVSLIDKVQTNKGIENYYKKYEDDQGDLENAEKKFDRIMTIISEVYSPEELKYTNFNRPHLFYTLFTAIGHLLFWLNGIDKNIRGSITDVSIGRIRVVLDNISAIYDEVSVSTEESWQHRDFKDFISASKKWTTDSSSRILRTNFLARKISEVL